MTPNGKYEIISIEMFAKTCIHVTYVLIIRNRNVILTRRKRK